MIAHTQRPSIGLALGLAVGALLSAAGCSDVYSDFDASVSHDASVADEGVVGEGGVPVQALFTILGCDKLVFDATAQPTCSAPTQRTLTFVPLGNGVTSLGWTFPGGMPASSTLMSPEVVWSSAGTFIVSVAAGGGGGSAVGTAIMQIGLGAAGATCSTDADCDASDGLGCLCGSGEACPASLSAGLCVRRCDTTACATGELCVDLTRAGADVAENDGGTTDGGATDPYRAKLCLPGCTTSDSCRVGFACRELPSGAPGSAASALYTWVHACFAPVLGDVGAACLDTDGNADGTSCLTGECQGFGARGVCTDTCTSDDGCPSNAACVSIPSVGSRCLARCSAGSDCGDPLMACQGPGAGGLGYTLTGGDPSSTLLCAPKRCTMAADCPTPNATCSTLDGAQFCER